LTLGAKRSFVARAEGGLLNSTNHNLVQALGGGRQERDQRISFDFARILTFEGVEKRFARLGGRYAPAKGQKCSAAIRSKKKTNRFILCQGHQKNQDRGRKEKLSSSGGKKISSCPFWVPLRDVAQCRPEKNHPKQGQSAYLYHTLIREIRWPMF